MLIRWPNDVVVEDGDGGLKKLGGILCEAVAQGERWAVVIGVGINIAAVALPKELPAIALEELGLRLAPRQVAVAIVLRLGGIRGVRLNGIVAEVRRQDALRGRAVRLNDGVRVWEGVAAGMDEAGRLLIGLAGGEVRAFERGTLHS